MDNAKVTDVAMNLYNLIEYKNFFSQTSWSLWPYYGDQPASDNNDNIIDVPVNDDTSFSFKYKK